MAVRRDDNRHALGDFESVPLEARNLARVVRQQPQSPNAKVHQHLGTFSVIAQIWRESERNVGLDGVKALFLFPIGMKLVRQANASPFLTHIENGASVLPSDITETVYDPVRQYWGGHWALPSADDMKEFIDKVTLLNRAS